MDELTFLERPSLNEAGDACTDIDRVDGFDSAHEFSIGRYLAYFHLRDTDYRLRCVLRRKRPSHAKEADADPYSGDRRSSEQFSHRYARRRSRSAVELSPA